MGAALLGTLLSSAWMTRYFLFRFSLTASDFGQYCESLGAFRGGDLALWAKQRSLVAGTLPGLLSDSLGIVDALLVGALISHVVMGFGIYLWARAAHSRLAGLVAVMLASAVAPLVHLGRTITFCWRRSRVCVVCAAYTGTPPAHASCRSLSALVAGRCCSSMFAASSGHSPRSDSPLSPRSWSRLVAAHGGCADRWVPGRVVCAR